MNSMPRHEVKVSAWVPPDAGVTAVELAQELDRIEERLESLGAEVDIHQARTNRQAETDELGEMLERMNAEERSDDASAEAHGHYM